MDLKTKILYVDDEELNLVLFKALFSKKYEVLTALDGYKGIELLEENTDIHIVFSDMQMPEMDGIEFIQRAKEKFPYKKYILITAFAVTTPIIQQALETKLIVKHLRKPIDKDEIINTINEAVSFQSNLFIE